jgi:hypothetical protein
VADVTSYGDISPGVRVLFGIRNEMVETIRRGLTMIADINLVVFYSGIAVGVVLTALFTYVVASAGGSAVRRPEPVYAEADARTPEYERTAA